MHISPAQLLHSAAPLSPEPGAGRGPASQQEKLGEACRQFEVMLLRQILATAQKPVFKSNLMSESVSTDIYQDMVTEQLADGLSRSGAFGVARTLQEQLAQQVSTGGPSDDGVEASPAVGENSKTPGSATPLPTTPRSGRTHPQTNTELP
jgi:Rod binding domain-containing protein